MLETVREEHPAAVKQALEEIGDVWLGAFRQLLGMDAKAEVEASWESMGLRIEIFRVSFLTSLWLKKTTMKHPSSYDRHYQPSNLPSPVSSLRTCPHTSPRH